MFSSMITAVADRFDSQFLTAYWVPAFVAVLGSLGIVVGRIGPDRAGVWITDRDSVQQTLLALILVVVITMLAFVLRALRLPIANLYAGAMFPSGVASHSIAAQRKVKGDRSTLANRELYFPQNDADTQPTRFGNVLAAAAEHPRLVYGMDGIVWWPRLMPLLPSEFQQLMGGAQAPTMALLNLSAVLAALSVAGCMVLALGSQFWAAAATLITGLLLCRLSYLAAVSQASELARLLRVAFDLYRRDILNQMGITCPEDLAAERTLWERLTDEIVVGVASVIREPTTGSSQATADSTRQTLA